MKARLHSSSKGTVLVAVLVVCLGMVSMALLFANSSMMSYRAAGNDLAGAQAEQAVEGGARYALYLLSVNETKGSMPDITSYVADNLPVGEATFWLIGRPLSETTNLSDPEFALVDEASKLNLNSATQEMLMRLPGMTEELAQAIVSWRDANGASSSDTYQQRQPSYHRKGAKFESVEELALLDGADPSILAGQDSNLNGVIDTEENDSQASLTSGTISTTNGPGIYEYVTAFSHETIPTTDPEGNPLIQATDMAALTTFLNSTDKLQPVGRGSEIITTLASDPPTGALDLLIRGNMSDEELNAIAPYLRFAAAEVTESYLVNVNTASSTVLQCIEGLTPEIAQEIVAARESQDTASTGLGWLREIIKDPEAAKAAAPFLTGKTFVVSADVAAVGRHGRGYRRTRFVIDSSSGTPKIIYRRNLAGLGWALGRDVRALLDEAKGTP